MFGVRKQPSLFSMIFVARSTQRSPLHCLPAHSARLASTRSRFGGNLHDFWNIRNLSRAITLRRIPCVPWLWVGRTGFTSAAHKRDRRLQRFSRSWKAAVGCKSQCAITFPGFSPACRSPDPVPSRPYSRCVGRPAFIDASDRGKLLRRGSPDRYLSFIITNPL